LVQCNVTGRRDGIKVATTEAEVSIGFLSMGVSANHSSAHT